MKYIQLAIEHMGTQARLHSYLKKQLGFPDHYGKNLDALYDCLTELSEPVTVTIPKAIEGIDEGLGTYGETVVQVFREAAKRNERLHVKLK